MTTPTDDDILSDPYVVASVIGPIDADWLNDGELRGQSPGNVLLRIRGDGAAFLVAAWESAAVLERIAARTEILDVVGSHSDGAHITLNWSFAPLEICSVDATAMRARWLAGGGPAVLDVLAIDVAATGTDGVQGVATQGLAALVGHEIKGIASPDQRSDLAMLVGRLAHHALRNGPVTASRVTGTGGRTRSLRFRNTGMFSNGAEVLIE